MDFSKRFGQRNRSEIVQKDAANPRQEVFYKYKPLLYIACLERPTVVHHAIDRSAYNAAYKIRNHVMRHLENPSGKIDVYILAEHPQKQESQDDGHNIVRQARTQRGSLRPKERKDSAFLGKRLRKFFYAGSHLVAAKIINSKTTRL